MKQRLCCWPSPMLGDTLLYLSPNKRHALFLEAYTSRSLCEELSSASVNSSKTAPIPSRLYFDLFFPPLLSFLNLWRFASAVICTSEMLIQIPGSVNCKQRGERGKKKGTRMIITFLFMMLAYIYFFPQR